MAFPLESGGTVLVTAVVTGDLVTVSQVVTVLTAGVPWFVTSLSVANTVTAKRASILKNM